MMKFNIEKLNKDIQKQIQHKIDLKTKPLKSLGQLETIALQIGLIQNTLDPKLENPHILVFAGDHGINEEGVSAYPSEVTHQMVLNFVKGGAAINAFCNQNDIQLKVIDAGVNATFEKDLPIEHLKIAESTNNFLKNSAMTKEQLQECVQKGSLLVDSIAKTNCNIMGFGEMGIGNTTAASALMSALCNLPLDKCVGKGTGLDNKGVNHKLETLQRAFEFHKIKPTQKSDENKNGIQEAFSIIQTFAGFEMAMMLGSMLRAAEKKMVLLIDGFISTSVFVAATKINPNIRDYAVFCHQSQEQGHQLMLDHLKASPVLSLDLRLGEGTGCALAYPLVKASIAFLKEMASFEEASVSSAN